MSRSRSLVVILGISAALLLPVSDAFARGGRGGGGGGRGGGGGGGARGGGGGMQQPQVNPVIAADQQQVTTFQAAFNTANTAYTTKLTSFRTEYMKGADYAAAQKAVDDANKELENARTAVIAKLKASDPAYRAASLKETDARKKLDQIRANGGNRDQISAQAQAILDAGDAVSKLEAAALAKDTTYQDAKKKLADASTVLDTQKAAMATAIAANEELTGLKTAVDKAKTDLADAQKKLSQDRLTLGG